MSTIEKIKDLLTKNNISAYKLSLAIGLNKTFLTDWTSGKSKPSVPALTKIADYFNVSVDYLLGREEPHFVQSFSENEMYIFPVIGTIAAGYDGLGEEDYTGEDIKIPPHLIKTHDPNDYFVLKVKGDSMYPLLEDGDKVLVRRCSTVESGTVAAIGYNGDDATVKKVEYIQGENWMRLVPRNPNFPTVTITGSDLETCRVYGEVVYLFREKIHF